MVASLRAEYIRAPRSRQLHGLAGARAYSFHILELRKGGTCSASDFRDKAKPQTKIYPDNSRHGKRYAGRPREMLSSRLRRVDRQTLYAGTIRRCYPGTIRGAVKIRVGPTSVAASRVAPMARPCLKISRFFGMVIKIANCARRFLQIRHPVNPSLPAAILSESRAIFGETPAWPFWCATLAKINKSVSTDGGSAWQEGFLLFTDCFARSFRPTRFLRPSS
jgi:hypothetical protein